MEVFCKASKQLKNLHYFREELHRLWFEDSD